MAIVPDDPEEVVIQMRRSDFLTSKIVLRLPDDDLADMQGVQEEAEFLINDEYPADVADEIMDSLK